MVRNIDGLRRSAQSRSDDAMQRAKAAIRLMQLKDVEIHFRSVAARARVSTAWLYSTKPLRDKIMKMPSTSPAAAGESLHRRQQLSH
jgi:hypothetical protein